MLLGIKKIQFFDDRFLLGCVAMVAKNLSFSCFHDNSSETNKLLREKRAHYQFKLSLNKSSQAK